MDGQQKKAAVVIGIVLLIALLTGQGEQEKKEGFINKGGYDTKSSCETDFQDASGVCTVECFIVTQEIYDCIDDNDISRSSSSLIEDDLVVGMWNAFSGSPSDSSCSELGIFGATAQRDEATLYQCISQPQGSCSASQCDQNDGWYCGSSTDDREQYRDYSCQGNTCTYALTQDNVCLQFSDCVTSSGRCEVCASNYQAECYNGDLYWYDSCGNREELKEDCGTRSCTQDICYTPGTTPDCSKDSDCKAGQECSSGVCKTKTTTTDCTSYLVCGDEETCTNGVCKTVFDGGSSEPIPIDWAKYIPWVLGIFGLLIIISVMGKGKEKKMKGM